MGGKSNAMAVNVMILHKLTVNRKEYFIRDQVGQLREQILAAVRSGGGYVPVPTAFGGSATQVLFAPGIPVTWARLNVDESAPAFQWFEDVGDEFL